MYILIWCYHIQLTFEGNTEIVIGFELQADSNLLEKDAITVHETTCEYRLFIHIIYDLNHLLNKHLLHQSLV